MNNDALPLYKEQRPTPKRISYADWRYDILRTIPEKEIAYDGKYTFVYLRISETKDYFITSHLVDSDDLPIWEDDPPEENAEIQIQVFEYVGNAIYAISRNCVVFEYYGKVTIE
jgi:hypothetical protein